MTTSRLQALIKEYGSTALILLLGLGLLLVMQSGILIGPHPLENQAAPTVSFTNLDGSTLDLADYLGKDVIVLDFWASWCGPCKTSLPEMEQLAQRLQGKDVQLFAVNVMEPPETVRNYLEWAELEDLPVVLDLQGKVSQVYHVSGIPMTVIIDQQGQVAHIQTGYARGDGRRFAKKINALLESS